MSKSQQPKLWLPNAYEKVLAIRAETDKVVVGMDEEKLYTLVALLAPGLNNHLLIEAVPGLGKTLWGKTLAAVCDMKFSRIQFMPDMRPSAIRGIERSIPGEREHEFTQGKIFANFVLGDEINRTPPTTSAALLDPMEELHISTDFCGTFEFKKMGLLPFFVFCTENPTEQDGTYPLAEAQKDRFMMRIWANYLSHEEMVEVMKADELDVELTEGDKADIISDKILQKKQVNKVINKDDIMRIRVAIDKEIGMSNQILDDIVTIIELTRPQVSEFADQEKANRIAEGDIVYGGSTRVPLAMRRASKALAFLRGRDWVVPSDIMELAYLILNHRIIYKSGIEPENQPDILKNALNKIFLEVFGRIPDADTT